jgi:hypothetical protein
MRIAVICYLGAAIAAISSVNGAPAQESQSENTYLITGLKYSPYARAVLKLQIANGMAEGNLEPLLGDKTPPATVIGSNDADGILKLTFNLQVPKTIEFRKVTTPDRIEWREESADDAVNFFRLRAGSFSETALTIFQWNCGSHYRIMKAVFGTGASANRLNAFLNSAPNLSTIPVTAYKKTPHQKLKTSLDKALRGILDESLYPVFDVPIGLEAFVAKQLRPNSDLFSFVDLDGGDCGGAEISYVVIPRALLFSGGILSRQMFEDLIDKRIRDFSVTDVSGRSWPARLEGRTVRVLDLPKPTVDFAIRVYAASEITRQVPGHWDYFKVNLYPAETELTTTNDYAVVVEVEKLKSVRRSMGSFQPPDPSYFQTELHEDDEAEVTAAITSYIAKRDGGWCLYDNEGYDISSHRAKCQRDSISR